MLLIWCMHVSRQAILSERARRASPLVQLVLCPASSKSSLALSRFLVFRIRCPIRGSTLGCVTSYHVIRIFAKTYPFE